MLDLGRIGVGWTNLLERKGRESGADGYTEIVETFEQTECREAME